MSSADLKERVFGGFFWSSFEGFGQLGLSFVIQLLLARLLLPEQFGLLAMVAVFIALAGTFTDAGFSQAVIQKKQIDQLALSSVYFVNLAIGCVSALLLWLAAPWIAQFYQEGELVEILRVICIIPVISAFRQVHAAQLTKALQFKRLAFASFPSTVISGASAIYLAYAGYGVWALVIQSITRQLCASAFICWVSEWRPQLQFSYASIRSLFTYGSKLAVAGLIAQFFQNLHVLVIGKFYLPVDVGYYQRADSFKRMGAENLNAIIARVTFPMYAEIQDDLVRMRAVFEKSSVVLALFFFSLMGMMAGAAKPMVVLLIGEQWLPSVFYLQLLCVVGALYPIHAVNLSIIKAFGRSDLFLRLTIIKRSLGVSLLLLTFSFGIVAMICGQLLSSLISLWINAYYTRDLLKFSYREQLGAYIAPTLLGFVIAFSGVWIVSLELSDSAIMQFIVALFGCALGGAFCILLFRRQLAYPIETTQRMILGRLIARFKSEAK